MPERNLSARVKPRIRDYLRYKVLSKDLFRNIPPGRDLTDLSEWPPTELSQYRFSLVDGLIRNKECAKARIRYKFRHVPEEKRDENHEKAIQVALSNVQVYQRQLDDLAAAIAQCGPPSIDEQTGRVLELPMLKQKMKVKKRMRRKKVQSQVPTPVAFWPTSDDNLVLEEFLQQTQREIDELYIVLYSRIVSAIERTSNTSELEADGSLVDALISAVVGKLTDPWDEHGSVKSWGQRVSDASKKMARMTTEELQNIVDLLVRQILFNVRVGGRVTTQDTVNPRGIDYLFTNYQVKTALRQVLKMEDLAKALDVYSEDVIREAILIHLISYPLTDNLGEFHRPNRRDETFIPLLVNFVKNATSLCCLLQQLVLPDWQGEFVDLPVFKIASLRTKLVNVAPRHANPQFLNHYLNHQSSRQQSMVARLVVWAATRPVPWEMVVIRPSRFLKELARVDINDMPAGIETHVHELLNPLLNILSRTSIYLGLQLGPESALTFQAAMAQGHRGIFDKESELPSKLHLLVSARSKNEIRRSLTDLFGESPPPPAVDTVFDITQALRPAPHIRAALVSSCVTFTNMRVHEGDIYSDDILVYFSGSQPTSEIAGTLDHRELFYVMDRRDQSRNSALSESLGIDVYGQRALVMLQRDGRFVDLPEGWELLLKRYASLARRQS
ncbi:hypothetical protein DFJ77DRAFT_507117 [Powellomyces hirtus]|nr:hypothetical protein DFJ77DRAFT_507117 [Powellomyces hirtus]